MNNEAFMLGYIEKYGAAPIVPGGPGRGGGNIISNIVMGGAEVSFQILDRLKTAALLAPILAGAAGGMAASMVTSPGKRDMDTLGQEIVNAELKQSLAQTKRRRSLSMEEDNAPEKGKEREVFLGA